jgi:hypothetical protein
MKKIKYIILLAIVFSGINLKAQERMTLQQCREMALQKKRRPENGRQTIGKSQGRKRCGQNIAAAKIFSNRNGNLP